MGAAVSISVGRKGTGGGDEFPPVISIIDFDIFLNLKGKVGGGGYDNFLNLL